jgi:hypothetical protein
VLGERRPEAHPPLDDLHHVAADRPVGGGGGADECVHVAVQGGDRLAHALGGRAVADRAGVEGERGDRGPQAVGEVGGQPAFAAAGLGEAGGHRGERGGERRGLRHVHPAVGRWGIVVPDRGGVRGELGQIGDDGAHPAGRHDRSRGRGQRAGTEQQRGEPQLR